MTVTIELSAEIEAGLAALSKARGLDLPEYLQLLLEEQVSVRSAGLSPAERAVARLGRGPSSPAASFGCRLSVSLVAGEVEKIERILTLLRDSPATYTEWKRLVIKHSVLGGKVHDARLVAAMNVHGVGKILTFDVDDFTRYGIGRYVSLSGIEKRGGSACRKVCPSQTRREKL